MKKSELKKQRELAATAKEEKKKKRLEAKAAAAARVQAKLEAEKGQGKGKASLAIQSGNGLLLKGGKEARRSNAILHKVITQAIPDSVGGKLIGLVTSREEIPKLLKKRLESLTEAEKQALLEEVEEENNH
ncbi:hypothetical protein JHK85_043544 [Glycine max]|nr:hypothetical protein JHK85_043544 [Glycine max]